MPRKLHRQRPFYRHIIQSLGKSSASSGKINRNFHDPEVLFLCISLPEMQAHVHQEISNRISDASLLEEISKSQNINRLHIVLSSCRRVFVTYENEQTTAMQSSKSKSRKHSHNAEWRKPDKIIHTAQFVLKQFKILTNYTAFDPMCHQKGAVAKRRHQRQNQQYCLFWPEK